MVQLWKLGGGPSGLRSLFVSAVAVAAVSVAATPAHAAMSCRDFFRASVLGDQDVLAQAAGIAKPWFDANKELADAAGTSGAGDLTSNPIMRMVLLSQLADACHSLPDDTVDAIVATLSKSVREQAAAARAHQAAERRLAPEKAPDNKAVENTLEKLRQQLVQSQPPSTSANPPSGGQANGGGNPRGNDTVALSADQRGAIGDDVRECWTNDAGALDIDKQRVLLTVTTDASGIARKAVVAGDDVGRMGDPRFRAFAERAIRASMDPHCANLPLPSSALGKVSIVTFRFSP